MSRKNTQRIWELDLLKGIALLFMIYFHIIYDLDIIFQYEVDSSSLFNNLTAKISGSLFIFAAGISSFLTRNNVLRAGRILAVAFTITILTYLYDPGMIITFGILHMLGTSILLSLAFRPLPSWALLALGALLIAATPWLVALTVPHHWLLFPVGIAPETAISSDYYPLLPWFGVFLLGNGAGKWLYREKRSLFPARQRDLLLTKIGQHTLIVYLLHQPVIIGVLTILTKLRIIG